MPVVRHTLQGATWAPSQALELPKLGPGWDRQENAATGVSFKDNASVGDDDEDEDKFGEDEEDDTPQFRTASQKSVRMGMSRSTSFRREKASEVTHGGTIDDWIMRRQSLKGLTAYPHPVEHDVSPNSFFSSTSRPSLSNSTRPLGQVPSRGFNTQKPDEEHLKEGVRETIREELKRVTGGADQAFRILDLSGSRHVSFQEFYAGLSSLGFPWQADGQVVQPRAIFKLFDSERKGFLTIENLFPETKSKCVDMRISTPDFWNRWCRGNKDSGQARAPRWDPGGDKQLQALFDSAQDREDVSEKRRWMAATMRRLKHQGKSDARCRELCALHLPKGTGEKDHEGVRAFSDLEVKYCKKDYSEMVSSSSRNTASAVHEMQDLRRVLQVERQRLQTLTHVHRHGEPRHATVASGPEQDFEAA